MPAGRPERRLDRSTGVPGSDPNVGEARSGKWVAGLVSYEAAPFSDPGLTVWEPSSGLPSTGFAGFDAAVAELLAPGGDYRIAPWRPELAEGLGYTRHVEAISKVSGKRPEVSVAKKVTSRESRDLATGYWPLATGY